MIARGLASSPESTAGKRGVAMDGRRGGAVRAYALIPVPASFISPSRHIFQRAKKESTTKEEERGIKRRHPKGLERKWLFPNQLTF